MGHREILARRDLHEAIRQDIESANVQAREKFGACPRYYRHFDIASFLAGVCITIIVLAMAASILSFIHQLPPS
jgi:hypothetical protein